MTENYSNMKIQLETRDLLTIGQLTEAVEELTGIHCTSSMIYNYEKKKLIQPADRSEGGFRLFSIQDVKQVACIKILQQDGFTLDEIGNKIDQCGLDLSRFDEMIPDLESQRTKILKAALQIFPERGYSGTNLADIAIEAGVSSSALYRYYDSKHDLFMALIDKFSFKDVLTEINAGMVKKELTTRKEVKESLVRVGRAFLDAHTENKEFHRMFLAESGNYPEIGRLYTGRMIQPILEIFHEFISYQIDSGLFRSVDPVVAGFSFFGNFLIIHSSQNLLQGEYSIPLAKDDLVEKLVDIFLDGVLA